MSNPYKVKGQVVTGGLGQTQNISSAYGTQVEDELTKMLSEELSKSINAEIIKDIYTLGIKNKLDDLLKGIVRNNKINDLLKD